jgi:diguanylate cyclase (GGDEF)-like protein
VWLLLLVCMLGLHIFTPRRALLWVGGLYLCSCVLTGAYLMHRVSFGDDVVLAGVIAQAYAVCGMAVAFLYVLTRYRDQTQRLALHAEVLERLAFVDPLTGLPNRRQLDLALQQQIELAERYATPFCVVLLDIDHFKRVNDRHGHLIGDQALGEVADTARLALRATDQIGRWGGEEFLAVLPQTSSAEGRAAAERVRTAIAGTVNVGGEPVTISAGVAYYQPGDTPGDLVRRADAALYRAKELGRNRVVGTKIAIRPES